MAEHELNKIVDDDGEVFNLRDSTKQPTADRVTSIRASSSASDDKYPSEKAVASAIESLDVSSVGGSGKYISAISETDGKISATATTMDTTPTANSTNAVTSGGIKTALDAKAPNAPSEVTIANGDKPLIADSSDSNKVKRASISFDTGVTNTFLRRNGTFGKVLYADEGWGGVFRNSLSPFDNYAFKNANCFFGPKPSAIRVEYTNDGGTTWNDYGLTDAQKVDLFSQYGSMSVSCGKSLHVHPGYTPSTTATKDLSNDNIADQRLRITICDSSLANEGTTNSTDRWMYCTLRRIGIYMSTQSAGGGSHCLFERRTSANFKSGTDTWVTVGDYKIQGDSGWNSIPCLNDSSEKGISFGQSDTQSREVRFTIWSDQLSATPNPSQTGCMRIYKVVAYSENLWTNNSANPNIGNYSSPYTVNPYTGVAHFSKGITSGVAIPVGSGGTGKASVTAGNYLVGNGTNALTEKTPNEAANNLINALSTGDATPTGEDYYVAQFAGGGTTTKTYHRRPIKALWEYIKAQISSVLGLTATSYGGNAATATTAQNYNTSTGTIKTALESKRDIYGDFYGEGTSIYGWKIGQMALGTGGSANGYMTAIVRIDRWTKLDNGDRDFDSFFGVVKLWARNSSDGTSTWHKATIHSFKPTAFSSTGRGYAIFKKSSNNEHTIDWYIGLAPDSDSTYTPKKEIAYSLIEISPMYEVNFTRGLERVSSDPGFDSWMQNCTREPWLAHDQYGAGSSSLPVYVDADNKVVGVDPKLTQGNLIRSLDVWTNINDTDEYVPVANNSATAQYPHGRYSFARIWAWIKGKLTSDSGVDISGNAATASDAKSGSTLATTLSGKAPTNHASSSDTYGKGTESNYGHVMLDNSALSASSTNTDGVACGKGHTHSQYLTSHQSISGKMNTSADNAASGALQNLTAQLNEGTDAFTDGTELFSSYAGDSGFATTGYVNKPYRRKASAMWSYINSKLVLERSPANVGTSHKRIQLGYGSYGSGVAGYCCYLVHIFFNFVGGTLAGKGVTVLVSYDWRTTTYQSPKCQVLNDNFFSDTGYRIVLANFLSDNNTKLHICLGLVNTSAPTTLVGFAYSYCKIMRVGYGLNWTESIASDDVGTYNYLVQSTYFMETDTNNKIKVVTALPSSPDPNTIYFV